MRTLPLLTCLLLASCGGDRCDADLVDTFPLVGSADVPLDVVIEFELDEVDGDETITLVLDGEVVPGTTTVQGLTVSFEPDEPLEPDTRYEATLDGPCGYSTAFTTVDPSQTGGEQEVDDPDELVGATYLIDLDGADVEPQLVSMLVATIEEDIALGVEGIDSDELFAMMTMVLEPGEQDLCVATQDLPAADWDNPEFDVRTVVPVPVGGSFALNELQISGRFARDGSYIDDTRIEALVDLRASEDPTGACFALALAGTPCVPCPDAQTFCIDVTIDAGRSARIDGWTLVPRTPELVAEDPACN